MIHLSLYLRCSHCPERFLVNSDNMEDFSFYSLMARADLNDHIMGHIKERMDGIRHDIAKY